MRAGSVHDMAGYRAVLETDPAELEQLAKDLLINVTSFIRDQKVFDYLAKHTCPTWCAPMPSSSHCASGSQDAARARKPTRSPCCCGRRSQPPNATSSFRSSRPTSMRTPSPWRGRLYPKPSQQRFPRSARSILLEGRARLQGVARAARQRTSLRCRMCSSTRHSRRCDLISCRNLLIYLGQEAQAKVISLFHFALRQGGLLLLGGSETAGTSTAGSRSSRRRSVSIAASAAPGPAMWASRSAGGTGRSSPAPVPAPPHPRGRTRSPSLRGAGAEDLWPPARPDQSQDGMPVLPGRRTAICTIPKAIRPTISWRWRRRNGASSCGPRSSR